MEHTKELAMQWEIPYEKVDHCTNSITASSQNHMKDIT